MISIASGITAENVVDYLPYIDVFLVGTGGEVEIQEESTPEQDALIAKAYYPGLSARDLRDDFGLKSFQGQLDPQRIMSLSDRIRAFQPTL